MFPIGSYYSYSFLWPPIGEGAIHVLLTADKIQSKCPRSSEGEDKPHPYIGYMLHCCTLPPVGAGFIPALPTADKIQSKCPAAARVGINPTPTLGKCDQCMNMYAKQTSRMISPSGSGASAGKGFMPFLKQCSTYFPLAVVLFHIGWDIF